MAVPDTAERCQAPRRTTPELLRLLRGPHELVAELELQAVERLGLELADTLAREAELLIVSSDADSPPKPKRSSMILR